MSVIKEGLDEVMVEQALVLKEAGFSDAVTGMAAIIRSHLEKDDATGMPSLNNAESLYSECCTGDVTPEMTEKVLNNISAYATAAVLAMGKHCNADSKENATLNTATVVFPVVGNDSVSVNWCKEVTTPVIGTTDTRVQYGVTNLKYVMSGVGKTGQIEKAMTYISSEAADLFVD